MGQFFITFGEKSAGHPFVGGWIRIYADSRYQAEQKFIGAYPNALRKGVLNCSSVYSSERFLTTGMLARGNMGRYCHEIIK